jgi:hypothetical protein
MVPMTNYSLTPEPRHISISMGSVTLRVLPAVFGEYRSLFKIHLGKMLEIPKKEPIHAVALLVVVACETLSKLLVGPHQEDEVFATRYLARHRVDEKVGRLIFKALRNGLAHRYAPHPITLRGQKIGLRMTWRGGPHLAVIGLVPHGVHAQVAPVRPAEARYICLDVSTMVADLNALFEEVAIQLDGDPKLRAEVVRRARDMFSESGAEAHGDVALALDQFLSVRELKEWPGPATAATGDEGEEV